MEPLKFIHRIVSHGLVRKTAAAFSVKTIAVIMSFLLNVVLARLLGPEGTGLYYLSLSCISIAIVVSQFGLGQSILRFISVSSSDNDWQAVKGVLQRSQILSLFTAVLVTIIVFVAAPWLAWHVFHKDELSILIQWMSFAIVPGSLFVLNGYSLQGLSKIKASIFVNGVSMPMFGVVLMLALIPYFGTRGSVLAFVGASWCTLCVSGFLWRKYTPQLKTIRGHFNVSTLFKSNVPLFWVSLSQLTMVWSSNIILGIWGTELDVGLFSIANKTAILVSFILSCVNTVIAPQFAAIYHEGKLKELQNVAIRATVLVVAIAMPILVVMMTIPGFIMSLFGEQFVQGAPVLIVLALGQFFYVVTGAVGYLLTMSGHENVMRNIMVFCSIFLIGLNLLLIPRYGAVGAAAATSVTLVLQNVIIAIMVWKIIGIVAFPFVDRFITRRVE